MRAKLLLVAAVLLVFGCDNTASRPDITQLKEGLNVLASDPAWGMDAAFVKGDKVIYLQTRVGPLKPDVYRLAAPDDPQREMDTRFVDDQGFTFMVQRGGDTLIDPSWIDDIEAGRAQRPKDPERIRLNYSLAIGATDALMAERTMPEERDHLIHLVGLARFQPPVEAEYKMNRVDTLTTEERSYNNAYNWFLLQAYRGTVMWVPFYGNTYHSATVAYECTNPYGEGSYACHYSESVVACNHGRCPWDSGMGYYTQTRSTYASGCEKDLYTFYVSEKNANTTAVSGGCRSGYNWNTPGGHDCNDDTAYEMWQIRNGAVGGVSYDVNGDGWHFQWRGDSNGNWFACECNQTGRCNDWEAPRSPGF